MKFRMWVVLIVLLFGLALINSCTHGHCGESKISGVNSDESHHAGRNCMNCHTILGEGQGCFMAAGTVYDSLGNSTYPNTTVRLYSLPSGRGNVVATLQADSRGNFYTTENIDFANGLFPAVSNSAGQTVYMTTGTTSGACSSCHGTATQRTIYSL